MDFHSKGLYFFIIIFSLLLGLQGWMITASYAVEVYSAQDLEAALSDKDVKLILIKNDITGNFKVKLKRDIHIIGNGYQLISLENESYLFDFTSKLIGQNNIIIEDLFMDAKYGIKFNPDLDVTLYNVTFQSDNLNGSEGIAIHSEADKMTLNNCEFKNYYNAIELYNESKNADYSLKHCNFYNCKYIFFSNEGKSSVHFVNCSFDNVEFLSGYNHSKPMKGKYLFDITSLQNAMLAGAIPFINLYFATDNNSDLEQLFQQRNDLHQKISEALPNIIINQEYFNKSDKSTLTILDKEILLTLDTIDACFDKLYSVDQNNYESSEIPHAEITNLFGSIFKLISLPVDMAVANLREYTFLGEKPQQMVEKNPFISSFIMGYLRNAYNDARILSVASNSLIYGDDIDGKNVLDLAKSVNISSPDFFFRESLNTFKDWTIASGDALNKALEYLNNLEKEKGREKCFEYKKTLSMLKDLSVVNSKIFRAFLFDMPMQVIFFVGYAKCNSDNVNDIFNSARQIAGYYPISRKLCVLSGTNSVSMMLIEQWKKSLKKDRFEELTAILQTEPSDLFDQPNIEDFFRGWY